MMEEIQAKLEVVQNKLLEEDFQQSLQLWQPTLLG